MECVFCAIAAGQLPAERIYEDEHFIVLLDIFPLRPAHVLIVSREHAPFLKDLSSAAGERLLPLAQRMTAALRAAGYGEQGINFLVNDGPTANQHVPHLHLHLIPRRSGDVTQLLWRALTRFLPLARKRIEARLAIEAQQLREALRHV
ncbi:HIT family protein [Pseudomonas sp. HMWF032]|uniref:HIT family protein n=1 Tax=unclassified Pseudomonas TaxID=196821 RepID=UPI000D3DCA7F|nr:MULTISPECIES: HIT family protein [unclassified Pseudomonas]PTS84318.1 HIT family protein [Pseudomonas sp. HMWF032]PTT82598.1 HIT family protein [Pseudomonas sp. HMWF010]WAC44310.1 HIT family protein [Pseudomonas sp. SL4(2022)]